MKYVPIPVALLEVGQPLPVDVFSGVGQLLLRKGQPVISEEHREKLRAFDASSTEADALAWQRAYERMVHEALRDGVDLQTIARMTMPATIRELDYVVAEQLSGGWLDLQEVLRGILYQGGLAMNPLPRLAGLERKARELLQGDVDDGLFCLFQALTDDSLGYCATHALLCAVVCELTGRLLAMPVPQRGTLMMAALTMNIGMAREQDRLSRQSEPPAEHQRTLIETHPQKSVEILRAFGMDDAELLDMVRWHHQPDSSEGMVSTFAHRRILGLADSFVARTAARKSRAPQSVMKAVKSMVLGAEGDAVGVGSAMAQAVGFYPPGTYVELVNGDVAVSVQRGHRANTPWVVPILDKDAMPISSLQPRNTSESVWTIAKPVNFETVRMVVSAEKIRRVRERIPG